ncbi:hypothetical protein JW933_09140 [candidate division FCPU426 bacterium]|nr:hypothetical protein [candidate division FCPU426 bacterium]
MRDVVLVLEIGKLRNRAVAFNRSFEVVAQAVCETAVYYPQNGWVEKNADEIWMACLKVLQNVVNTVGEERLAGLAVTNVRDAMVIWDRTTGRPIHAVLGSEDRRNHILCQFFKKNRKEPMVRYRTGLFVEPHLAAIKIAWILEHFPDAKERARNGDLAYGGLDTWIIWNLTRGGVHATDVSNAARTLLYDINSRRWEPQLLAAFGVPAALLPKVQSTVADYGQTSSIAAGFTVPILAVATVPSAELYAQTDGQAGGIHWHCGKTFNLQYAAGEEIPGGGSTLSALAWQDQEKHFYAAELPVHTGGFVIQWLKDGLGLISEYGQAGEDARAVSETGDLSFIPAWSDLGPPQYNLLNHGAVLGLTYKTTRRHLIRAALEGMAHQVADAVVMLEKTLLPRVRCLRADGGAARIDFLLQFQADLLGVPVERSLQQHLAALGMARWLGWHAGLWAGENTPPCPWQCEHTFEPGIDEKARQTLRWQWQSAVEHIKTLRVANEDSA